MSSIEYQILLAASDVNPDDDKKDKLLDLISQEVDPDRLIDMAVREGVAGLLYKSLKKQGVLGYLGSQHIQQLQSLYYNTVRFNIKLMHDLKGILQQLNQNNIRAVLLQGIPLLQQIYKDIGLRPLTDIDLWVLPESRDALARILIDLDYEAEAVYPNTFKKGATIVDINTHILWADRIKSRQILLNQNQQELFHNCRAIDFDGQQAYGLGRADQILYLSMHVIKHYAERLIWLVDIKNLLLDWDVADWELLIKRCRELGQENIVFYTMFLITQLFGYQPPNEVRDRVASRSLNRLERKVLGKRLSASPLPIWAPLLLFTSGKKFHKKVLFVFESLFPRPEILRQVFTNSPDLKVWQLYLKRVWQIVGQVKL
jgi:hypothetical protein